MNKINYNIGNVSFTINYDSEKNKMMKVTNYSGSKKKIIIRGFLSMDILPTNVWETEIDNGYYFKFSKKFNGYNMNTNGYRSHCIVKYFSKKSYFFLFTANL